MSGDLIPLGEPMALEKRKLSEETCAKWKYHISQMGGETVQVASYCNDQGQVIAQKVRTADKDFKFLGDSKEVGLYGQWLWRDSGKMVVVTEGEIDALSVSQLNNLKWPVVSVPNGAGGAKKSIVKSLQWLERFETVVFMFDNDKAGIDAAKECAFLLTPGKAKIASLPLKDANEMLQAGRGAEVIQAMWDAKVFRPDGLVTASEVKEQALKPVEMGLPWPWAGLTAATYGRRGGEIYMFGAGTGVGKTDVLTQIIMQTVTELKLPVAAFFLESTPADTLVRVAGKYAGKCFHVPGEGWTKEELESAIGDVEKGAPLYLYNSWGATDWDIIKSYIQYLAANGVKDIFIDHLTALSAGEDDEKVFLEETMAEMGALAQRFQCRLYVVSHLATPEGKSHEEGGRVTIRHFKGSRAIGFWSHFMFGLERDQQEEDLTKRNTTTFRILKDRKTGRGTGRTFLLTYDPKTGRLNESGSPFDGVASDEKPAF